MNWAVIPQAFERRLNEKARFDLFFSQRFHISNECEYNCKNCHEIRNEDRAIGGKGNDEKKIVIFSFFFL